MKSKWPAFIVALGLLLVLAAFVTGKSPKEGFESDREIIAMRKIAHDVLLYTGDSSTPIPPVDRISPVEFRVSFAHGFSFAPDSLVRIIGKVMATNKLADDYIVNVVENHSDKVIFGYAMLGSTHTSIVPCGGRTQPLKQYALIIRLSDKGANYTKPLLIAGAGLLGLGLLIPGVIRSRRKQVSTPVSTTETPADITVNTIPIGQFLYYPDQLQLQIREEQIPLTVKEAQLLSIFASQPNEVVERSRLQKELWEDEGVIVGRSLDVFISRLRKKLEGDPAVKLVNIHGKGYRLDVLS
jgi:hypothetical protein